MSKEIADLMNRPDNRLEEREMELKLAAEERLPIIVTGLAGGRAYTRRRVTGSECRPTGRNEGSVVIWRSAR